jgi:putative addiction module component (TIGR02574 family)
MSNKWLLIRGMHDRPFDQYAFYIDLVPQDRHHRQIDPASQRICASRCRALAAALDLPAVGVHHEVMSAEVQRILEAALKLTDTERVQLVTVLADSIGDGVTEEEVLQAWIVEAKQRMKDIRSGKEPTIPAAEVFRKGRALIEQAKQRRSVV